MNDNLGNLCSLPGVIGAALYDPNFQCVEARLNPPYEPEMLAMVFRELSAALEACSYLDDTPVEMGLARLSDGFLAFQAVGQLKAMVLAGPQLNPAMLHVAFGVLARKLSSGGGAPAVAGHSITVSSSNLSIDQSGARSVSNAIPAGIMRRVLEELTGRIGPMAKLIMKKELARRGATSTTLTPDQYGPVVEALAERIESPEEKAQFLSRVRRLAG